MTDCRICSGMSATGEGMCGSSFKTLLAYAPVTVRRSGESTSTTAFFHKTVLRVGNTASGTLSYTTSTITNTTVLSTGFALADAIDVAWEVTDLSKFPVAYATSLAYKIGEVFRPTAVPATFSRLPAPTTLESPLSTSSGLSTGARAGIGVGTVIGVAAIIGVVILSLCLRRRRRRKIVIDKPGNELPEMVHLNSQPPR